MSQSPHSEAVDGFVDLPSPWRMHHGATLEGVRVAYRIEGQTGAPIVAALGGISAHRFVCGDRPGGWWPALVGAGRGVDTRRYRVLGIDYLGGSGDSATPEATAPLPAVSAFDQVAALLAVVRRLELAPLHAIVGASYGGMVALAFAMLRPDLLQRLIVVGAAHRPCPLSTAWRSVQRQIVRDALARGDGAAGLRLARALAMTTYRSGAEFAARFAGPAVREQGQLRFPVEQYLLARGEAYARRYRPESFLALSESIDLFEIDPAAVRTPATLIAVHEDQLVPLADMQALARGLAGPCRFVQLASPFGHDAFLKEGETLKPIVERALVEKTQ